MACALFFDILLVSLTRAVCREEWRFDAWNNDNFFKILWSNLINFDKEDEIYQIFIISEGQKGEKNRHSLFNLRISMSTIGSFVDFSLSRDNSGGESDLGRHKVLVLWFNLLCKSGLVVNEIILSLILMIVVVK